MITTVVLNPAVDKIYFIDDFNAGRLYRYGNPMKSAGGKGINVSRVVRLLGQNVNAIGFKAGITGEWLESELKILGVNTCFIDVEGESRTNINIIDKKNLTETEILENGPLISFNDKEKFMFEFDKIINESKILICTGTIPEGIPIDFYGALIQKANQYGIKTILDSSGLALLEGIKAKPYLIKPNIKELSIYSGRDLCKLEDILCECKKIINMGVKVVVASLGERGALLVMEDLVIHAVVNNIDAVNTIGSGDSIVAGISVGIGRNYNILDAFKLGMSCAASNAQFDEIGIIDMDFVSKVLGTIKISEL